MKNAITIDLEDYFHVSAFADRMAVSDWDFCPRRVEANTEKLLALLDSADCLATFFTLGWLAVRFPQLIRKIADAGHEIACHSHEHRLIYEMKREAFREDTRRAKHVLEDVSGKPIYGYRAPSFSIREDSLWALTIIAELGFRYDSSIFPVRHPNYGVPHSPRFPFMVNTPSGPLIEFPMPTLEIGGKRSPFGGGAYLRLLPYFYTRWAIRFVNEQENQSVCIYLHPWEVDPEQPRLRGSFTARLRHYIGLGGTERKLRSLLRDFECCSLETLFRTQSGLQGEVTLSGDCAADWTPKAPN